MRRGQHANPAESSKPHLRRQGLFSVAERLSALEGGKARDCLRYGKDNFLFVGVEVLLDFYMAGLREVLSQFSSTLPGYDPSYWQSGVQTSRVGDLRAQWSHLKHESKMCRRTLLVLTDYIDQNFNTEDEILKPIYKKLFSRYNRHVEQLDRAERDLNDRINQISSAISTEMAQVSIRESKRVMLRESPRIKMPLYLLSSYCSDCSRLRLSSCVSRRNSIRHERTTDQRDRERH